MYTALRKEVSGQRPPAVERWSAIPTPRPRGGSREKTSSVIIAEEREPRATDPDGRGLGLCEKIQVLEL